MARIDKARAVKWLAISLGGLIIVLAGLLAVGVRLIERPAVKAAIQERLSAALGGKITWEELEVRLLPAPHGELRGVRVEIPGAISAQAERLDAYLRLWPLLRGRPEIASLSASRPQIRLAPAGGADESAPLDPAEAYRRVMASVVDALRRFAPDTQVSVEDAAIDLAAGLSLRELNVAARAGRDGLDLEVRTASNLWKRLQIKGRVEYADLSARADVKADELFDEATVTSRLPATGGLQLSAQLRGVKVAPALAIARHWAPAIDVIESSQGQVAARVEASLGEAWRVDAQIEKSDAAVKLAQLPWKIAPSAGRVSVSAKSLEIRGLGGTLGDSSYAEVAARLEFGKPLRLSAASGKAKLRLEQWYPWLQPQVPALAEITSLSGGLDVTLQRMNLRLDRPGAVDFEATAVPHAVSAALKALPAPVALDGGEVRINSASLRLQQAGLAMLDAATLVSGTVAYKGPRIELSLDKGVLGEKAAQWILARAGLPERFEPRTPMRLAAQRLVWGPGQSLDAEARIDFDGGPQLSLALAWKPQQLEVRRLAIKDARSDAVLGARVTADTVRASFSGTLEGRSITAVLRRAPEASGSARGDFRVTIDRTRTERTLAEGKLSVEALELGWLTGGQASIRRADLTALPTGMRIIDADVEWQEQRFKLRGEVTRTAQGPVIDAQLESPGILVERLLPAQSKPAADSAPSKLWPLPITGRVALRAGFVQYQRYRIEPLEGTLDLERERAGFGVKQARMCGVSFPLQGEAAPAGWAVSARLTMKSQPIEETLRCLTGDAVQITGDADLRADVSTRGKPDELVRNLTGTAQADLRKGRLKKFALIGNILSVRNLASLGSREEGFSYRSLTAKGSFQGGAFLLEEGFFDSDAARLAASGRVDMLGANSRLDVLVGLLTTVDRVAGAIPIISDVFGGSLTALPVSVTGDIRNPLVVPLGPQAVTDRLLGIFERTLKLPGKLVAPAAGEAPAAAPR